MSAENSLEISSVKWRNVERLTPLAVNEWVSEKMLLATCCYKFIRDNHNFIKCRKFYIYRTQLHLTTHRIPLINSIFKCDFHCRSWRRGRKITKYSFYTHRSKTKQSWIDTLFERTQKLCAPKNAKSWKSSCPLNNAKASNMRWYKSAKETVWNERECFESDPEFYAKGCWISSLCLVFSGLA